MRIIRLMDRRAITDVNAQQAQRESRFRRLHTDIGLMVLSKALGLVFSVGSTAVLARELGPTGRGAVAVAFGLTLILAQLGTFGIASANPYFVAQNGARLRDVVVNSLWIAITVGLVMMLCGAAVKLWLPSIIRGVDWQELLVALVAIPAVLVGQFLQSVLLGLGRALAYNMIDLAQALLTFATLCVVLILAHGGITAAMLVTTGAAIASAVAYAVQLRHEFHNVWRPHLDLARAMMTYAFRIYVATLMSFLVIRLDILLVNHYRGTAQAGIYSVTAAIAAGMFVFPSAVGVNLFPRIAHGDGSELTARVFRISAGIYGLCCLVAIPLASPFIHLLYGARFAEAASLFYWLLPGIFSLGMLTVLANHFAGRGFPLAAMLVWFVGLGVNLAMNVVLLPSHGTYVASLASSVAYTVLLLLHVQMFAKENHGYKSLLPRANDFSIRAIRSARAAS
jgi:O-antigen/teichoic acid export membrane protein